MGCVHLDTMPWTIFLCGEQKQCSTENNKNDIICDAHYVNTFYDNHIIIRT